MLALVHSATLLGIDAVPVTVECSISDGQLPTLSIVGLPTTSVKEGAVRVKSALAAVGHDVPSQRVTVNLAPADLRKLGSALDLPTALSILFADQTYEPALLDDVLVVGELGLDGSVRAVPGVLAATMLAKDRGMRAVLVPDACAAEALVVDGITVYGARHLRDICAALAGHADWPTPSAPGARTVDKPHVPDMADVRGQHDVRNAIETAVAGGHNILLAGPPGTGKTMLARRIPGLLPPMTREEALETTKIYSSLGLAGRGLMEERPFRAPHHTISGAALLGGGSSPKPGEISLAHNGVLFLDELPEFSRAPIEGLRQPLEERFVTIARVHSTLRLPSSFMLVAAANPCPCGWSGSALRECTCSRGVIERYRSRMSGPLLDRIDLQVHADPVPLQTLRSPVDGETTAKIRERVLAARDRQAHRLAKYGIRTNAEMTTRILRSTCPLDSAGERELSRLVAQHRWLSARSIDRILKVARTIADMWELDRIDAKAIEDAAKLRLFDSIASGADKMIDQVEAALRDQQKRDKAESIKKAAGAKRIGNPCIAPAADDPAAPADDAASVDDAPADDDAPAADDHDATPSPPNALAEADHATPY